MAKTNNSRRSGARIVGDASRENTIEIKPGFAIDSASLKLRSGFLGDSSSRKSNSLASGTFLDEFEEGESSSTGERLEARAVAFRFGVRNIWRRRRIRFDAGKFNIDTNFVRSEAVQKGFR